MSPPRPSRPYPYHSEVWASLRDTDAMGHVNHAVYLSWIEEIRTRYVLDRRGFRETSEVDFVVASARLDYRSPVYFPEIVDLWLAPCRIGRASWDLFYEARARKDGRLVLEARTVQVQYDYGERRSLPISDAWRRLLEADLIEEPGR